MSDFQTMDLTRREILQGGAAGAAALSISALGGDAAVVEVATAAEGRAKPRRSSHGARPSLSARIKHADPATFNTAENVHGGAGPVHFTNLIDYTAGFTAPLHSVYRAILPPGSSLGHHFHHSSEETYVVLDGNDAEFTINGRTSLLRGPAGALSRVGNSHAIYNPGNQPIQFMVFAASLEIGGYDAWDLGDDRADVSLDARPVFMNFRLDRSLLAPDPDAGPGVRSRRILPPSVFVTNWGYLDHVVVDPGSATGTRRHKGVEEVYFVVSGEGSVRVERESAAIRAEDGIPIYLGERHSFASTDSSQLEMLVMGIARTKSDLD
jgi:mannose-6-phosphate isomerase-like protein (cupin superfamily)